MKLLLDTCVWGGTTAVLIAAGHDVRWMGETDPDPGDEEIMRRAYDEGCVLITLDKDFGELAIVYGKPHRGIVRLVNIPGRQPPNPPDKTRTRDMSPRLRKYAKLLQSPACWPALLHGVAATLDHDVALGRDRFATVIDVGANKGQFAVYARTRWPKARLICFEPLPGPRAKLARVTRGQAEIHDCAPGAASGEGRMHLATRTDSSSLLALGARQKAIYGMEESGELRVPIKRLDACLPTPPKRPVLLKIDVQGFELEVLKGATDLLPNVDAVYVEASDVELYEGQALHEEIERFLIEAGFGLDGRFNTHVHQGEPVQADLLFRRRTSSKREPKP